MGGLFYGWIVVAVTVLTLLVSAGVRAAPGLLINPIEHDLLWNRDGISLGVAIGLFTYGFAGPFAGRLMDRFGPRVIMLIGMLLVALSTAASAWITDLWQFWLLWGLLSGTGTGVAAAVLGATVANRWFVARRGLVLGVFGAALSAGQLIFVPAIGLLLELFGWRISMFWLAGAAFLVLVPIFFLMRDDPASVGLQPYGAPPLAPGAPPVAAAASDGFAIMARALQTPEFWLLAGTFFVCGATSNGLIGTHFIPHSLDHGIPHATAVGALAVMGAMNFVGTVASGWLTDRYDPRKLLAIYYSFRGLSLLLLPFVTEFPGLAIFAVGFGLDYIATVPPTSALCADIFGRRNVGTIFGWVFFSHQIGAAAAAYIGGLLRVVVGDYQFAFLGGGALAILAGMLALMIHRPAPVATPSPAVAR